MQRSRREREAERGSEQAFNNVKVAVRVRPLNKSEMARGAQICLAVRKEARVVILKDTSRRRSQDAIFRFDHVYASESTQEELYNDIGEPVVEQTLEGFNSTVFAYGQTGSGKTHTMMGGSSSVGDGLIPTINFQLFQVKGAVAHTLSD
jgi:DNA replication protein DnaC